MRASPAHHSMKASAPWAQPRSHDETDPRPWEFGTVYVDGTFVPAESARVSVFDHSFLYGDGVFETVLIRNGRPFRLAEHIDRLRASADYLRITAPASSGDLSNLVCDLVRRNELAAGFVRIVVSRGSGYPASDPRNASRPTLVLLAQEQPPVVVGEEGLRVIVAKTTRTPPESLDPRAKTNNYGNHIVAKLEAISAGADDAILLDTSGRVAELPGSNIFATSRGRLVTPPEGNLLNGITRAALLELAREGDIESLVDVAEEHLTREDLLSADEVFVSGTGTGLGFVSEIDGVAVGDGSIGPIASELRLLYEALVDRETGGRDSKK
jgi:branched-chain amino acid aminotransferase